MSKREHYKIKCISLVLGILFAIFAIVAYRYNTVHWDLDRERDKQIYSGVVEGEKTTICPGEDGDGTCDLAVRYVVGDEEYFLVVHPSEYASRANPNRIRYNVDKPSEALIDFDDWYDSNNEEYKRKYIMDPTVRMFVGIAAFSFFNAFLGYYIDRIIQNIIDKYYQAKKTKV